MDVKLEVVEVEDLKDFLECVRKFLWIFKLFFSKWW